MREITSIRKLDSLNSDSFFSQSIFLQKIVYLIMAKNYLLNQCL